MTFRILLSPPDIGHVEYALVADALESGWVAPIGPDLDLFEAEVASYVGVGHAVALSSGTGALHLALLGLGVRPGDEVVVPTLTFAATAFAVTYVGARPILVDSELSSWNLDPTLLEHLFRVRKEQGRLPAAVVSVDVFGRTADYDHIDALCSEFGVPLIEDAAEALGATYRSKMAGAAGRAAVFSFNGNKIMTTSGGGMLVTNDQVLADTVRYLSTQARQPVPWYEHADVGFNYRMSNILAALGRGQLARLPSMIQRRQAHRETYRKILEPAGVSIIADSPWGVSNAWLSVALFENAALPTIIRESLADSGIETRPVWKPMHQQPVFVDAEAHLNGVSDDLFARGLCLPSGSRMSEEECLEVATLVSNIVDHA